MCEMLTFYKPPFSSYKQTDDGQSAPWNADCTKNKIKSVNSIFDCKHCKYYEKSYTTYKLRLPSDAVNKQK